MLRSTSKMNNDTVVIAIIILIAATVYSILKLGIAFTFFPLAIVVIFLHAMRRISPYLVEICSDKIVFHYKKYFSESLKEYQAKDIQSIRAHPTRLLGRGLYYWNYFAQVLIELNQGNNIIIFYDSVKNKEVANIISQKLSEVISQKLGVTLKLQLLKTDSNDLKS